VTIVACDASALEWVCGTYLSQDQVAMNEIINKVDQHTENQRAFNLPSRLIAKTFVFRLIYGGSSYSYANDVNFEHVSKSTKFWDEVIERFYGKYKGWADWHIRLMQEATTTGRIVMPTSRAYSYEPNMRGDWPRTTILNYPVQGLGADIMAIIRVAFWKRLKQEQIKALPISSVHDSIVVDCPEEEVDVVVSLYREAFQEAPRLFKAWFGEEFNLPLRCECSVGNNMSELEEYK
jgi:DNA polymerase I-like protein with 3'-5' exonuclease and polymerase domains